MIKIRDLRKSYGSNHVLHGIDLDVKAGEFVVMLGLSGAGKSTLLRCMNGLNQADSGTLQVGGIDLMQNTLDANSLAMSQWCFSTITLCSVFQFERTC